MKRNSELQAAANPRFQPTAASRLRLKRMPLASQMWPSQLIFEV
jgi:hypothetical protein